jgi:hypothetical protein
MLHLHLKSGETVPAVLLKTTLVITSHSSRLWPVIGSCLWMKQSCVSGCTIRQWASVLRFRRHSTVSRYYPHHPSRQGQTCSLLHCISFAGVHHQNRYPVHCRQIRSDSMFVLHPDWIQYSSWTRYHRDHRRRDELRYRLWDSEEYWSCTSLDCILAFQ